MDYDYRISHTILELSTIASFMFLLCILGYGIYQLRHNRLAAFGIFFFFITLSVESSVIPLADIANEHRLYLPLVGAILAVLAVSAPLIRRWCRRVPSLRHVILLVCLTLLIALGAASYRRNLVWADDYALATDTLAKAPHKARVHFALAMVLYDRGDKAGAEKELRTTISLSPAFFPAYHNLGNIAADRGDFSGAKPWYETAVRLAPQDATVHRALGTVAVQEGNLEQALPEFLLAVQLNPADAKAYNNLGVVYAKMGRIDEAKQAFGQAIRLDAERTNARRNLESLRKTDDADSTSEMDISIEH